MAATFSSFIKNYVFVIIYHRQKDFIYIYFLFTAKSSMVIFHSQNDLLDFHCSITLLSHSLLPGMHMLLLPTIGCLLYVTCAAKLSLCQCGISSSYIFHGFLINFLGMY